MAGPTLWCRVTVIGPCGLPLMSYRLQGDGTADLDAVDRLARLQLAASRLGAHLELREVAAEFAELLELAGLRRLCG